MSRKPNLERDIYHGELLSLRAFIAGLNPPMPFPASMIRVLRWFRGLPVEERLRILNTEPSPAETYDTRFDHGPHAIGARRTRKVRADKGKPRKPRP